jgi:citrate lyase beta subunit
MEHPTSSFAGTNVWSSVRCLFESPTLDDRKWSKLPSIPADAFILDLEDAVPAEGKEEARRRVVAAIQEPSHFGGRLTAARPNPLHTRWGEEDVRAMARAGVRTMMIAKVDGPGDIDDVQLLCREEGADPTFLASIETARGVVNAPAILSHSGVVAASFGPGDLHVDVGMTLYEPDGRENPGLLQPKMATILAGVAADVPVLGIAFAPDLKNLVDVRSRIEAERRLGFSGCCAFYPPHVDLINAVFTPSPEELSTAEKVVALFELAVAEGKPAVQLESGEALLAHQYKEALTTLARAR